MFFFFLVYSYDMTLNIYFVRGRGRHATHHNVCVEIKGQNCGSPLPPCWAQELNSSCQALQQAPLPTEPSLQPLQYLKRELFPSYRLFKRMSLFPY